MTATEPSRCIEFSQQRNTLRRPLAQSPSLAQAAPAAGERGEKRGPVPCPGRCSLLLVAPSAAGRWGAGGAVVGLSSGDSSTDNNCTLTLLTPGSTSSVATMQFSTLSSPHGGVVHDIAFDYYGNRFASCSSDRCLKVWDLDERTGAWSPCDIPRAHQDR